MTTHLRTLIVLLSLMLVALLVSAVAQTIGLVDKMEHHCHYAATGEPAPCPGDGPGEW